MLAHNESPKHTTFADVDSNMLQEIVTWHYKVIHDGKTGLMVQQHYNNSETFPTVTHSVNKHYQQD